MSVRPGATVRPWPIVWALTMRGWFTLPHVRGVVWIGPSDVLDGYYVSGGVRFTGSGATLTRCCVVGHRGRAGVRLPDEPNENTLSHLVLYRRRTRLGRQHGGDWRVSYRLANGLLVTVDMPTRSRAERLARKHTGAQVHPLDPVDYAEAAVFDSRPRPMGADR